MPQPQGQAGAAHTCEPFGRRCFVTVGATAGFPSLLQEVLSRDFVAFLDSRGFAELVVQTGPDQDAFEPAVRALSSTYGPEQRHVSRTWPAITTFSYSRDMASSMLPCRSEVGERLPGVMISHAGSGTILDAMRLDIPLIVVPNRSLQGNHQEELADAVVSDGWAVKGELGRLTDAVDRAVEMADLALVADSFRQEELDRFPTQESDRSGLFDWAATSASHRSFTPDVTQLRMD